MQDEDSVIKESWVKLTGQLAVNKFELVQPLNALRFELGQLGFGFLPVGVILLAFGFQFLVILHAVLEGSCSNVALLLRLASGRKSLFEIFLQHFMKLGAPPDIFAEPFDLGLVPLFRLLRLSFSVRKLIFQFQMLKNEQLEELATPVVRFLQNSNPGKVKKDLGDWRPSFE